MSNDFSWVRCENIVGDLTRLVEGHAETEHDVPSDEVIDTLTENRATRADFIELDERPGLFDSKYERHGWHRVLRVARNNPDNELFEVLLP